MTEDSTPVLMLVLSMGGACCAIVGAMLTLGGLYMYYRSASSGGASDAG